jgi:acetylornithine deacetylase/succinyl-diaminopimelate desuccinylase-like protein
VDIVTRLRRAASPTAGNEAQFGLELASVLSEAGAEVEIDWVVPGRPNVVAKLSGHGTAPALLLAGHLNSAHHPGPWRHEPQEAWVADGHIRCGAVTDMLGGWAAIAAAVEHITRRGAPPGDLVVLATMSHDIMATGVKYAIAARPELPRLAVWCDPTDLALVTSHGGAIRYEVDVRGRAAHVSCAEDGVDALAAAVSLLPALADTRFSHTPDFRLPHLPRHLIGRIGAGTSPGIVADRALIAGDVRTVPGMTRATVRRDIERVLRDSCPPDVLAEARITAEQRPLVSTPSAILVDALAAAHRAVHGEEPLAEPRLPSVAFCTAAADLVAAGIDSVVYGPGRFRWSPDESVAISDLTAAASTYASIPDALAEAMT